MHISPIGNTQFVADIEDVDLKLLAATLSKSTTPGYSLAYCVFAISL